jgi:hypothetical protein
MVNEPPVKSLLPVSATGFASWPQPWASWFTQAWQILVAVSMSGTTANRPTALLWTGRPYFDTTLNRPIWYTGTNWIRADGTVV